MFDRAFLKNIYDNFFKDKYYSGKKTNCESILSQWGEWKGKINAGTLSIDEYVNLRSNNNDYLIYFLNNTSTVYGRSREGNAHHWMVKMNDDGNSYYTAGYVNNSSLQIAENLNASKAEAEMLYSELILPLLQKTISSCNSIQALRELAESKEYKWFRCEQMLEKIMVLEAVSADRASDIRFCLPNFYKQDVIDRLYYECFELSGETSRVGKSYEVMKTCYEWLDIDENSRNAASQFEISLMLWDLATYASFVTEDAPNVIFYGSPGTGKTYTVKKTIQYLTGGNENRTVFIQCHPGFGYEDFIEGLKPIGITSNESVKIGVVNGIFKDFCIRAKKDPDNEYFFIADEINRANLSSMFGEVLSLLEPDYRDDGTLDNLRKTPLSKVIEAQIRQDDLPEEKINEIAYRYDRSNGVLFGIPKNVRFIGMMNDVDKSIDSFDLALRRRFKWIRKDCNYDIIADQLSSRFDADEVELYVDKCRQLNKFISQKDGKRLGFGRAYEFGHAYYLKIKSKGGKITRHTYESLFDEHLKPVLTEYIRSFMDDDEIDGVIKTAKDIFCK